MNRKTLHFLLLAALVAASSFALADPPARVGRIAAAEGAVTVRTGDGSESGSLLNWPVSSDHHVITAAGARAEVRVGAAAIRLDGDSDLAIEQLDDDVMRLRLHHGAVSVHLRDPALLGGFELATAHARVLLTEPGVVKVETERVPDSTRVSTLEGIARVEGGGTALTLRAGKRADVRDDDIATGQALADNFDAWAQNRDRRDEAAIATRYVPADVTGYEELDRHGSWTVSSDYGPLWAPRNVASDWAPYRDGRWTWLSPWGWTWIDNAPWGYAPSHYGRWVLVNRRWCWAPGRVVGRPVWAPALVGWVGGPGWAVEFRDRRRAPGLGWYPLTPRDRYVPHYPVSPRYEERLGWRFHDSDRRGRYAPDGRRDGLTIVPRDRFEQRRTVAVNNVPRATIFPNTISTLPPGVPVTPPGVTARPGDRNGDGVADRLQRDRNHDGIADGVQGPDRNRDGVADRLQTPDRNRDGIADGLQPRPDRIITTERWPERDRNHDGVADRLQRDRNGDGIADAAQGLADPRADRNRDGIPDRAQGLVDPRHDRNGDGIADRAQGHVITTMTPGQFAPAAEQAERRHRLLEEQVERRRELMDARRQQNEQRWNGRPVQPAPAAPPPIATAPNPRAVFTPAAPPPAAPPPVVAPRPAPPPPAPVAPLPAQPQAQPQPQAPAQPGGQHRGPRQPRQDGIRER
ncbi:DUF6600 domain-containing protein [[Empedobacter] haloabium]|uniref:DUF6600 domain-containing protein n=1 Tax=[Empedobacter] haloabium TaxID=592317 RepID=A0ABZ1UKJ7_9BURK